MENSSSSGVDHGRRGMKQPLPWTTTTTPVPGHNFSLAAAGCFPWSSPPQTMMMMRSPPPPSSSYTCGYCRREFRSAQALGGHMNVHRRDRARLRQCCSAASASAHQHRAPPLPNLNFSPPHCAAADPVIYSFFSTTTTTTTTTAAACFEVSLELEIGVCGGGTGRGGVVVEEDGLDLELRLGCAWE